MQQNYSRQFLSVLQQRGIDAYALLADLGLQAHQLERDENLLALISAALQCQQEPALGLYFGQSLNLSTHGVFGYALMSSGTVGDVLRLLQRYHQILLPVFQVRLEALSPELVSLSVDTSILTGELDRFFSESFYAAVYTAGDQLLQGLPTLEGEVLQLAYPEPAYAGAYLEVLGEMPEFGAEHSRLLIPTSAMELELPSADPATESVFVKQCEMLRRELRGTLQLSARVQQILLHRRGDFPSAAQVAEQLNVSESTLRRRLRSENTSFQDLLDQVRLHLSQQYLQNTALTVAEVGQLVGYDDVANFRRAFRSWCGHTPVQAREQAGTPGLYPDRAIT